MKRVMNSGQTLVAESLAGFVAAHEDLVAFGGGGRFLRRRALKPGKVALISGGGGGHEPLHGGFIGAGMLDAACTGHIFTSPTPDQIVAAMDEMDTGAGCLLVVKNYDGDVMNFEMAAEMAAPRHRIEMVVVEDDAAYGPSVRSRGRRGVAGTIVVEKILGAAAERGRRPRRAEGAGRRACRRACAAWASPCAASPCRTMRARPSPSARTRWRSASASMASRAFRANASPAPTRSSG